MDTADRFLEDALFNGKILLQIGNGQNAYFEGDLLSAKGQGSYSRYSGFDAYIQAQVFSANPVSRVLRVITDPFFKLLEFKLEGPLSDPSWHLDNFSAASDGKSTVD